MNDQRISILGCGWLGLPLARYFAGKGFRVKGSTTSEGKFDALRAAGVEPYRIVLGDSLEGDVKPFLDSEILVVNIPPQRRDDIVEYHVGQISMLIDAIAESPVKHLLFVSATSVYPALGREVVEDDAFAPEDADTPVGQALLYVEDMLLSEPAFNTTVVRFSGLIGPGRYPVNFMQRMKEIADSDQPVNLVHLDDCVQIIGEIISRELWGEVFNASCPGHPTRREFYAVAAESHGLSALPPAAAVGRPFKTVSSEKLEKALGGYRFLHPDPLAMARTVE
ncbi:MAG: SDR family oxidoreductase [Chlorobiaceae bacterium]|nr:SDR family oxidoreductase [Chlorobiaceae bacterium]